MSEPSDNGSEESDADLDEIMAATAKDRRRDGLKMLGGGLGALALSALMYWLGAGDGEVSRLLGLILTYGSLLLGILLSLFGVALIVNSYYVEP